MYRFVLPMFALAFASVVGCSEADKVDNAFDCSGICNKYKSCFDDKYNVDGCAERCRGKSNDDKDFQRKADTCNACIGDQSCTGATFECAADCAGIVP